MEAIATRWRPPLQRKVLNYYFPFVQVDQSHMASRTTQGSKGGGMTGRCWSIFTAKASLNTHGNILNSVSDMPERAKLGCQAHVAASKPRSKGPSFHARQPSTGS